jgi:assimilatory nitrate reductase catalytic subunit
MDSNVAVSAPSSGRIGRRLGVLDFFAVCDPFLSETAASADVVLPVTQWAEESGTMTNLEGGSCCGSGRRIRRRGCGPTWR